VSGAPKYGYYDARIDALKDIYSFNVRKATVLDSKWFTEGHANAIALERAGNSEAAEALFNELLNASQLTYGVINRDATKTQFAQDQMVDVTIGMTDVEDKDANGVGLGTFHKALIAEGMSPVASIILVKTKRFGADIKEETPVAPVAPAELKDLVK
jgi:hypothetical protein